MSILPGVVVGLLAVGGTLLFAQKNAGRFVLSAALLADVVSTAYGVAVSEPPIAVSVIADPVKVLLDDGMPDRVSYWLRLLAFGLELVAVIVSLRPLHRRASYGA